MIGGHGHVRPRPDGARARCGGPAVCSACALELSNLQGPPPPPLLDASDPWLRVGMGGMLPGPSQASLGSPDWVASFAAAHPMNYDLAKIPRRAFAEQVGGPGPVYVPIDGMWAETEPPMIFPDSPREPPRENVVLRAWADDDTAARRKAALQRRGQG